MSISTFQDISITLVKNHQEFDLDVEIDTSIKAAVVNSLCDFDGVNNNLEDDFANFLRETSSYDDFVVYKLTGRKIRPRNLEYDFDCEGDEAKERNSGFDVEDKSEPSYVSESDQINEDELRSFQGNLSSYEYDHSGYVVGTNNRGNVCDFDEQSEPSVGFSGHDNSEEETSRFNYVGEDACNFYARHDYFEDNATSELTDGFRDQSDVALTEQQYEGFNYFSDSDEIAWNCNISDDNGKGDHSSEEEHLNLASTRKSKAFRDFPTVCEHPTEGKIDEESSFELKKLAWDFIVPSLKKRNISFYRDFPIGCGSGN